MPTMSATVHLLGRPWIEVPGGSAYRFRSQKSWGLLAYLLLSERPPTRSHLCELLFDAADDPLRALRWSLAEIRRGLGEGAGIEGDPVAVRLPADSTVDVDAVMHGSWREAVGLPGLGRDLLELLTPRGAAGFDSWLLTERRRVAAASEAILHEAALAALSQGKLDAALEHGLRGLAMNPLDENSQALVIRIRRRRGDAAGAEAQYDACAAVLREELGVEPGVIVESALREEVPSTTATVNRASVAAMLEAGSAAVFAGATSAGVQTLRTAVLLADEAADPRLRTSSRLVLAEALIHSIRGLDEEGIAALHDADRIAGEAGDDAVRAEARTELGYVDFLRARYDRAEHWLTGAIDLASDAASPRARALMYLGSVESDRANYGRARALLDIAMGALHETGEARGLAYALSMRGRLHLLQGDVAAAETDLSASIATSERDRWLAFLPWPQALLGEARLAQGDLAGASDLLDHAFARACQLADPCWEGIAARGRALVAAAQGDTVGAFGHLADARARSTRFPDSYLWLDAYILDAQCELGRRYGHPDTLAWTMAMQELAARTGMRDMTVRALLHGGALGRVEDADGARLLAVGVESPALQVLVSGAGVERR